MSFIIKSPGKLSYSFIFFVILIIWCTLSIKTVAGDSGNAVTYDIVSSNLCDPNVKQYSGYIRLNQTRNIFFWFFESRNNPKTSPLTLWLNGGPGCSSMIGLLQELGPCEPLEGGSDVKIRPESWNEVSNMLFVDQPVGSGYSFGDSAIITTEQSSQDLYDFLQGFFEKFPEYSIMDFHIFGESYAGHFIPSVAKLINENNLLIDSNDLEAIPINLQSIAIGNGWIDPKISFQTYADFMEFNSYGIHILNSSALESIRSHLPECERLADICYETETAVDCRTAFDYCNVNVSYPFADSGLNYYDIRTPIETMFTYPPNDYMIYLNKIEVMSVIGAQKDFVNCSNEIVFRFVDSGDEMRSFKDDIEYLLDKGIHVLLYYGDADFICNWFSGRELANELEWSFQSKFNSSPMKTWTVDNKPAGEIKSFDKLTFLRVFEAGHEVPFYQPKNSLEMFRVWINNEEFETSKRKRRRINKRRMR